MKKPLEDREILFEMGKKAIPINSRLFRENAGEFAQNLLKMHKELYPELYSNQKKEEEENP